MDDLKYKKLYLTYKKKYLELKNNNQDGGMGAIAQRSVGRHLKRMAQEETAKQLARQMAKQGKNSGKRVINNMTGRLPKHPKVTGPKDVGLSGKAKDLAFTFGTTSLGLAANPFAFMGATHLHQNYRHNRDYLPDTDDSNDSNDSDEPSDLEESDDSDLVGNLSNNDYLSQSNFPYVSSAEDSE
jgi:hypothetical protein